MPKEVMIRRASDNQYLHRDFHHILNVGIDYLADHFSAAAVAGWLTDFSKHFYSPESERVKAERLSAVEKIFRETFASEDAEDVLSFEYLENALIIRESESPAVRHLRFLGSIPSRYYLLTTSVVWRQILRGSGIQFEVLSYDPVTGKAEYLFYEQVYDREETL